ncbi:MAG TPA: hypothetical protein P5296_12435, partial [Anaerohalosphaeraceae bacterium]|nr:hypothetical protein [Anaerohalosphaeraceae bacterium]
NTKSDDQNFESFVIFVAGKDLIRRWRGSAGIWADCAGDYQRYAGLLSVRVLFSVGAYSG